MVIGKCIKYRREELGITQDELAKRLGYKSRSTINKIELGINDVSYSKLKAIAAALDTNLKELLGWDREPDETDIAIMKILPEHNGESETQIEEETVQPIRIKELRKEKKLTLDELGKKIHINKATVQRYETGKIKDIKYPVIKALAAVLDCSPEYLLGETNVRYEVSAERRLNLFNVIRCKKSGKIRKILALG